MSRLLIWFVTCFFSTLGIVYLFVKVTKIEFKINLKFTSIFLLGVLFATLLRYFHLNFLSSISYFIYIPFLFYYLKPMPFHDLFFYLISIWFIGMFLDLISMLIVSVISYLYRYDVIVIELFQILPTIIVFFLFVLIGRWSLFIKWIHKLFNAYKKVDYLDFSLVIFSVFLLVFTIFFAININNLSIGFFLITVIVLVTFYLVLLIKCKFVNYENKIFLNTLKENNDFYISVDSENSIFRHNLMAKLLAIKSVSNRKSRKLIDDLLFSFNTNIDFSKHIQQIPYGLNGIIYQKLYPYLNLLNVKISNQIDFDIFEVLTARRYNVFVEKMIIALDNAIESSLKSNDKLLVINLYQDSSEIVLEIKNTFGSNLNIDDLGHLNYSTKSRKRGLGLYSALRNKEVLMSLKVINDLFVVKIVVKIKNEK